MEIDEEMKKLEYYNKDTKKMMSCNKILEEQDYFKHQNRMKKKNKLIKIRQVN